MEVLGLYKITSSQETETYGECNVHGRLWSGLLIIVPVCNNVLKYILPTTEAALGVGVNDLRLLQ